MKHRKKWLALGITVAMSLYLCWRGVRQFYTGRRLQERSTDTSASGEEKVLNFDARCTMTVL